MPTSSIRPLALSGLLAGAAVVFLGAQAQTPPEKPQDPAQQPPKFRVEANFVRVDAYPLRDGKPVLDLKAADFEVFEDGVAQKNRELRARGRASGGPAGRPSRGQLAA